MAPAGFREVTGSERVTIASRITIVVRGEGEEEERYMCKRLAPRALREPWMRELLAAEGRLLASMEGRGAPRLVAAGEDELGPWIVMELVPAQPLSERIGERAPESTERATRVVFRTLATVHEQGVIHSDVSPANVLLGVEREPEDDRDAYRVRLIDFGLARWHGAPQLPPGPFRGTLLYAAPEVARGEPFDARADLFSAAASLLHAYSGEPPRTPANGASEALPRRGPHQTYAALLLSSGDEPVDVWAARASQGLARATRDALLACCAFDGEARPASAEDILRSLGRL